MITEIRDRIRSLKSSKKELRKFAIILFCIFAFIAGLMFWRAKSSWLILFCVGMLFLFIGLIKPLFLKSFYTVWMAWGFILGWVMTGIILTLSFFVIVTPMGLLLRKVLGKDLLDEKIEKSKETYWKRHKPAIDRSQYLKRF
jgi:membrane-bound ClpP family serine protease